MKIGKSDKLFSNFEVNGRRIVMSRNGINGAARPIKNCSRQDVYEAMADIYDEFYFNEIDTEAESIRRGQWIKVDYPGDCCYRCSECGFIRDAYLLDTSNYCPKCGAKMEREKK